MMNLNDESEVCYREPQNQYAYHIFIYKKTFSNEFKWYISLILAPTLAALAPLAPLRCNPRFALANFILKNVYSL